MKIWLDVTNAPHVNFFRYLIEDLAADHEFIITSRDLSNTLSMLDMFGIEHTPVGKHYGASKWRKVLGFFSRIVELRRFLKTHRPDVAISHSSFYSPVVARSLGVPSIYLNDNEHAKGNIVSYLFCNTIMVPETQSLASVRAQFGKISKAIQYPGVKEGVYLWSDPALGEQSSAGESEPRKSVCVFIRPEPWAAQYYSGAKNFLDNLIADLCEKGHRVTLLPRGKEQIEHYKATSRENVEVIEDSLHMSEILSRCDLFVGAGGTMTREFAVLGVPTISTYQGELLDVDKFLIERGYMLHDASLVAEEALSYYTSCQSRGPSADLIEKGQAAYKLIINNLLALAGR